MILFKVSLTDVRKLLVVDHALQPIATNVHAHPWAVMVPDTNDLVIPEGVPRAVQFLSQSSKHHNLQMLREFFLPLPEDIPATCEPLDAGQLNHSHSALVEECTVEPECSGLQARIGERSSRSWLQGSSEAVTKLNKLLRCLRQIRRPR